MDSAVPNVELQTMSISRRDSITDKQQDSHAEEGGNELLEDETSLTSSVPSTTSDNVSLNRTESTSSQRDLISSPNNNDSDTGAKTRITDRSTQQDDGSGLKGLLKNPFSLFKKTSLKEKEREEKEAKFEKMLAAVKVESLPQLFVTKYLGSVPTKGLYGVKYTREAAEDLISNVGSAEVQKEMSLMQLHVSLRGIHVTEYKKEAKSRLLSDQGLIPLEFISYGVQDMRYTKVFTFIVVRELSSRKRSLECHAYLCDSSITCRKLALSLALAFQEYAKNLKGKPHKFGVDLQKCSEIEQESRNKEDKFASNTECDA